MDMSRGGARRADVAGAGHKIGARWRTIRKSAGPQGSRDNGLRLSGTNLERAGDHNQRVTLHAIRVSGPITRTDLAQITGLTPPAIANITRRLMHGNLIREAGRVRGARGQPPIRLVINPDSCFSIGVNVDRDHITLVVLDFLGTVRARASREIQFALPETVQSFFQRSIGPLLEKAGVEASTCWASVLRFPMRSSGHSCPASRPHTLRGRPCRSIGCSPLH